MNKRFLNVLLENNDLECTLNYYLFLINDFLAVVSGV